jgi:hypothetical protein
MNAKIREHAMQKVPFLLVVGDKKRRQEGKRALARERKTEDMGAGEFVEKIRELIAEKSAALWDIDSRRDSRLGCPLQGDSSNLENIPSRLCETT